jgi:peroxiredoxin
MSLNTVDNKSFQFSDFKNKKATVIIFLLSDCPASESYTLTLNKLSEKYSEKNISFAGVFPGTFSSDEELVKFRDRYKIRFTLLKDPSYVLAKKLDAQIAPSCFVIDKKGNTIYKGRIDDWLYALGKKRSVIKVHDLENALKAVLSNKPVAIKETNPIGCILEFND